MALESFIIIGLTQAPCIYILNFPIVIFERISRGKLDSRGCASPAERFKGVEWGFLPDLKVNS